MAADIFANSSDTDLRKKWALMQLKNGTDMGPSPGPIGALAKALQGSIGGYMAGQSEADDKKAGEDMFNSLPGISKPAVAPTQAMPTSAPTADVSQPRGIRNNNPLNIEAGGFTQGQPGFAGSDGRFAKFENQDQGLQAANKLLDIYRDKHGLNTVSGIVGRWAPSTDGNNVSAYASNVAGKLGIDPNAPIPPEMRQRLIEAMGQHENGRPIGQQPFQVASLGPVAAPGQPAPPQMPPAGPQVAQNGPPGVMPPQAMNAPVPNRSSVQIPPDVQETIRRLGADPRSRPQAYQLYMQYAKPVDQWQQFTSPDGSTLQRNTVTGEVKNSGSENHAINEVQYAQKNWKQLGFPDPASSDPKTQTFWKEYNAKRLGGAGVNVAIDQSAPNEFEKEYGQGMGKRALDVVAQGDAATQDLQQSALSRAFLTKIKTGALAPAQATVGAWAKAVGIDPAKLGIDPNLPAIDQAAKSAMAQQTVSMIGSGGFPANNFSDADRKFLTSIPAHISNLPESNEILADVRDRVAQRKIERANAWSDAREQGQSYEKFESAWRKKVAKDDMFADVRGKVEGMQSGSFQEIDGVQIRKKQ